MKLTYFWGSFADIQGSCNTAEHFEADCAIKRALYYICVGLFCGDIGIFREIDKYLGLFCRYVGLFCRYIWLFNRYMGSFAVI